MPEKYGFEHQDLEPVILYATKKKRRNKKKMHREQDKLKLGRKILEIQK